MSSTRTQVYLTAGQRQKLDERAKRRGVSMAQLVREAIDEYLSSPSSVAEVFERTFGSNPELEVLPRSEWRERG